MKTVRRLVSLLKWLLLVAVMVEILSFAVVTISNFILYGHAREGSRVRYDPYALFLNQEGPRPTPHPFPPSSEMKTKVLWFFGGSTMRGATDEDDKTIPGIMAGILNRNGGTTYYLCSNFGENSFNSLLEAKYLQKLLIEEEKRPDLIFFYDGANECVYFVQHRSAYGHHGYRRMTALVESYHRSLFGLLKPLNAAIYASFTRELYDKIMQTLVPLERDSPLLAEFLNQSEKRYDHVHWLAESMGARFLLVLQPVWWAETGEKSHRLQDEEKSIALKGKYFRGMRENFQVVYDALGERLKEKPYFVNFRECLISRTVPAYKPDGVHLQDEGRRMVAEQLAEVLKERGLP